MKKKYSTLLNFALAGCLATTLAACGSDGDKTNGSNIPGAVNQSGPIISIGGTVLDTNGNPMSTRVSCQGTITNSNELGQWFIPKLQVTNTAGLAEDTEQSYNAVRCVVEAPAGYLGAIVSVTPEAQMDSMWAANGYPENFAQSNTFTPIVTFIDNLYAEAGTAWLPKLGSTVRGRLEDCDSEGSVVGATVKLDMLAVDNNSIVTQAGGACAYGCSVDYSTMMYSAVTLPGGYFQITDVPDDTVLRLYVEDFMNIDVNDDIQVDTSTLEDYIPASTEPESCGGGGWGGGGNQNTFEDCEDAEYITTINEGIVNLGDVCVRPIPSGDATRPCVKMVQEWVSPSFDYAYLSNSFPDGSELNFARLHDGIDGTQGINIDFNEYMDSASVDITPGNSVVIWDEDEQDYIQDFDLLLVGHTLTITTAAPVPAGHRLVIYLLRDDFRDTAGNFLHHDDLPNELEDDIELGDACDPFDHFFVEDFYSNNWIGYIAVGVKIFEQDTIDTGEVTGLMQQCLDYSATVSAQTDLMAEYPTTFRSDKSSTNTFFNLNADDDYEYRLEALADVLECPEDVTENADIAAGYASVTFTAPTSGAWELASGYVSCEDNCYGAGDGMVHTTVVSGADIGDVVCIDSLDDFDNVSAQACTTPLVDCVAPTTVLNYAYNTCGHLGQDYDSYETNNTDWHEEGPGGTGPGFDTDYAAHICVDFEAETLFEYGDGGENTGEGTPGVCGIPTLNITCRLLKDPADAQTGSVSEPISFFGLYTATRPADVAAGFDLYDATEFAAWVPFEDTIGIAFSEDITLQAGAGIPEISWTGDAGITGFNIGNNISHTDDGDTPDGGPDADDTDAYSGSVDLVQLTIDDVLTLANDDHQKIMGFNAAIEDTAGNPADNAEVVINDLMPPFVEYAYWNGSLVIQFNEAVAPDTSTGDTSCLTTTATTDYVTLFEPNDTSAHPATIGLHCAVLSNNDTMLTIPANNLNQAGVGQSDYFPDSGTNAMVYDEAGVPEYVAQAAGPYNHGILGTSYIPDVHGNMGHINEDGNEWSQWDGPHPAGDQFEDTDGNTLCIEPRFAVADVVGGFDITSQDLTMFDPGDPDCSAGGNPFTHRITYTFSHPLDLDKTFGANTPCSLSCDTNTTISGECTVADVNTSCLDANWVDVNVFVYAPSDGCNNGTNTIPISQCGDLTGLDTGALNSNAQSWTIDFENDCLDWNVGDIIDPKWNTFSAFGVGSGINLNAQSVSN